MEVKMMGLSLSSSGDVVAGGSSGFGDDEGRVRVFKFSSGLWSQLGLDLYEDFEYFGSSVALSSDASTLIASGDFSGGNSAVVYIYSDIENNWVQKGQELTIKSSLDGRSVAISADGMIFSTIYNNGAKVYAFPTPSSSPSLELSVRPSDQPTPGGTPPAPGGTPPGAGETSSNPTLSPTSSTSSCCCCCCEKSSLAKLLFGTFFEHK